MTISYTQEVANMSGFGVFWKLLFRWRGSVYKMIWRDLLIFTFLYILFNLIYRLALNDDQKLEFEKVVLYCRSYIQSVPMNFLLGFYVSLVVQRWWGQFETLPWPNTIAIVASSYIRGANERARILRRTLVRYINISFVLTMRMVSPSVKKDRFPTLQELVEEGYMLQQELPLIEASEVDTQGGAYWVPLCWAINLIQIGKKEGFVTSEVGEKTLIQEICNFRGKCGGLLSYDWISIPLVYTQVVTIAVYSYLYATVLASQMLEEKDSDKIRLDAFIPVMTYLKLIFYMGWMKVAESLVNPFGKDDEDFDVDPLITKNLRNCYIIVDKMMDDHPVIEKDKDWNKSYIRSTSIQAELSLEERRRTQRLKDTGKKKTQNGEQSEELLPKKQYEDLKYIDDPA